MRDIEEMTHDEVLSLTRENLERMIDYECAKAGVPILKPPTCPVKPELERDQVAYVVQGITTADRDLAGELSLLLMDNKRKFSLVDYDYKLGSEYKHLKGIHEDYRSKEFGAIEKIEVYSRDVIDEHTTALAEYKVKKDQYDKDKRAYDEGSAKRQQIASGVYSVHDKHLSREDALNHARIEFERYRDLADGNLETAFKFYDKAYTPDPWTAYHLRKLAGMPFDASEEPDFWDERKEEGKS